MADPLPPAPLSITHGGTATLEQMLRRASAAAFERAAKVAEEAQRRHDERCPPGCRCADGHHVAAAIRALAPASPDP